jgi:hypothetical protein
MEEGAMRKAETSVAGAAEAEVGVEVLIGEEIEVEAEVLIGEGAEEAVSLEKPPA